MSCETAVIYSLATIMSPPVHRVFREVLPYENRKQDLTPMKSLTPTKSPCETAGHARTGWQTITPDNFLTPLFSRAPFFLEVPPLRMLPN